MNELNAAQIERMTQQTAEKYRRFVNPTALNLLRLGGFDKIEWRGSGSILTDLSGNEYIDCLGGYGVFSLGHCHPYVTQAVADQLTRLPLSSKTFLSKPLADLAERLASIAPRGLQYSFFCNSGAEAVEAAIKFARRATGKTEIITLEGSYHGKTLGALSASGRELYKTPFAPLVPGFLQVPFGDIEALESAIDNDTAAVLLEPIQGENGVRIPPDGYLREVREAATENGALLILDEVQTGLGRTGRWFACDHENVAPDMMTLAKALGGGVMPIGAVIGTEAIWQAVFAENPYIHTSTFGGNPLACAAALATLEVIERDNLSQQAYLKGEKLRDGLASIATSDDNQKIIAQVRGRGLMIGVTFHDADVAKLLIGALLQNGVIAAYTLNNPNTLRFEPPLIITGAQIERVLAAFATALTEVRRLLNDLLGE